MDERAGSEVVGDTSGKGPQLLLGKEVYAIVGAAFEVHRVLGGGFLEAVYQKALEIELGERHIPFEPQRVLAITYKGHTLDKTYCADMICYGQIVVELKAMEHLSNTEMAQVLNYLKATGFRVGVLINFGRIGKVEWERLVV